MTQTYPTQQSMPLASSHQTHLPISECLPLFSSQDGNFVFREATQFDFPAVWGLADDYKSSYLSDDAVLTKKDILDEIKAAHVFVLTHYQYPVAAIKLIPGQMFCELHFLIRPQYWRRAKRLDLLNQIIDTLFERYQVGKFKALFMRHQGTALKLLKYLKFRQAGFYKNEVNYQGQPEAVVVYELHKDYWHEFRKR